VSARINDETLHRLIDLIYESACDPTRWPEFLHVFARAVAGPGALIYTRTASNGHFSNAVVGVDPEFLRTLDHYDSEEMRPYAVLVPHLARAARIQRRFAFLQGLATSSLAVLDTVPAAVMLLDASSRTLHGNAAAHAELRRGDPFRLGPSGELCVRGPSRGQLAVRTAIGAVLDPQRSVKERAPCVAQVARSNGEMLSIQALRLPRGNGADRRAMIGPRIAACALVVHGAASLATPSAGLQLLRHVYGLTPAEVKVALAIAEGETIRSYAERRGLSRNTVATQLKRAFDKTGLRRQSELVRWLLQCGAALRPGAAA